MSHSFVTANTLPNPPITELITITVATATHPTKQPLCQRYFSQVNVHVFVFFLNGYN